MQVDPIVGESSIHTLDDLKQLRERQLDFHLVRAVLERYFRDDDGDVRQWLFPDLLAIANEWRERCLTLKDNTFLQLLILAEHLSDATTKLSVVSMSQAVQVITGSTYYSGPECVVPAQ